MNRDNNKSTPNINDASSLNNPNQPLTLSERLNGLSTGGQSVSNIRRRKIQVGSQHGESP